jgi:hypothetical protein
VLAIEGEGNAYTRDLLYDKARISSSSRCRPRPQHFYVVIDYDAPINEKGTVSDLLPQHGGLG